MKRHFAQRVAVVCLLLFAGAGQFSAGASVSANAGEAATIAALKVQLQTLSQRLEELEKASVKRDVRVESLDTQLMQQGREPVSALGWVEKFRLKGDMRYRHEYTDDAARKIRNRERIRARLTLTSQINDSVEVGLGVATGTSSAISANQTLDGGFSTKGLGLDIAYARWDTPLEGLQVSAGKFKTPLHRVGGDSLVWDPDLRPEGAALNYDKNGLFVNAATLWVNERSQSDDSLLLAGQLGWRWALDGGHLTTGAGYYVFSELEGTDPLAIGGARGNQVDVDGNYFNGFNELELFLEYAFQIGDHPVSLFADYIRNTQAKNFDTAFALGGRWEGQARNHRTRLEYVYRDLEANSMVGAFTDSDFARSGTDASGHVLRGTYWFTKAINLRATMFLNKSGADMGVEDDYSKVFLDLNFKY